MNDNKYASFWTLYRHFTLQDRPIWSQYNLKRFFCNYRRAFGIPTEILTVIFVLCECWAYLTLGHRAILFMLSLLKPMIIGQTVLIASLIIGVLYFINIIIKNISNITVTQSKEKDKEKSKAVKDLIFIFYYVGAMLTFSIFIELLTLILGIIPNVSSWVLLLLAIIDTFLIIYTLIYAVSLIGTSLNLYNLILFKNNENRKKE